MITITKERLLKIQQWRETYGLGSNVVLPAEEAEDLARIALASLEAEPVAWVCTYGDEIEYNGHNQFSGGRQGLPLYAAMPATVDKNPLREFAMEYIESWELGMAGDSSLLTSARKAIADSEILQPAPVSVPGDVSAEDCPAFIKYDLTEVDEAWARGFNACRAAMLQGAEPVTTAYKLPEGYALVPVEPTYQMCQAMGLPWESPRFPDRYKAMIAAAPHFREIWNSSTNNFRENAETSTKCWCRTCRPVTISDMRFVVCLECGNKRCPHANDHRNACTGSNEPGQEGSAYPAAPQQEV